MCSLLSHPPPAQGFLSAYATAKSGSDFPSTPPPSLSHFVKFPRASWRLRRAAKRKPTSKRAPAEVKCPQPNKAPLRTFWDGLATALLEPLVWRNHPPPHRNPNRGLVTSGLASPSASWDPASTSPNRPAPKHPRSPDPPTAESLLLFPSTPPSSLFFLLFLPL